MSFPFTYASALLSFSKQESISSLIIRIHEACYMSQLLSLFEFNAAQSSPYALHFEPLSKLDTSTCP